jgi:hypothetical protein
MRRRLVSPTLRATVCAAAIALVFLTERARPSEPKPIGVGMVALVANPQRYEGKITRTVGFLCVEFEGNALYVHDEDYRHGLSKNSMALRLSDSQSKQFKSLSLRYVIIEATAYANGLESTAEWAGALGNITRLEVWPIDRNTTDREKPR